MSVYWYFTIFIAIFSITLLCAILLLRPPAIAAARNIAIGLSVCLSHHVHNVLNVLKAEA